jgi:hypothetical protein
MMSLKSRMKILEKIAQQTGTPAVSQPSTPATSPPAINIPAAPSFNPISGPWAWLTNAYNPASVGYLSYILHMIHVALHYASSGKFNLLKNQNNIASIDPSGAGSTDAKNLVLLIQTIYRTFLNNGQPFANPPVGTQVANWARGVSESPALLNLSQLNPTGPASQKLRLDGSFRQNIINYLGYLVRYNPPQTQQTP